MKVGFLGLGIMGKPMARNLLKAGFDVTVWNRTASKCEELVNEGAEQADSPADAAARCDVVITIVSDTPDVEEVLFGDNGVLEGIGDGKVVIDMSTISPEATESFGARLAEKGAEMLDAPVSGGESGAIEGRLAIMVGGKEDVFQRCLPLFEAMGRNIVRIGGNGDGQRCKLCNQIVGAINIVATCEGLRFAEKADLDLNKVQQVVSKGAAGSWMMENLGPKMIANDWRPGFLIRLQDKDLRLVREAMKAIGIELPGTQLAATKFDEANEKGFGEEGTQALYKLFG